MVDREILWNIEPHTKAKHKILKTYLKAWFPIMSRYNSKILYVDGFSGPGEYKGGEPGSPIIAIEIAQNHILELEKEIVFLFIDKKSEYCDNLGCHLDKIQLKENIKYQIICDEFENCVKTIFDKLDEQRKIIAPSFFLLDPFGFSQISFDIIRRIMNNDKCEVLITFVYDSINRFMSTEQNKEIMDNLFGTNKWEGINQITTPDERKDFLLSLYINQLVEEADISYVRIFEMKNKYNHTVYYLIYATNHILGLEKMKEAMWKVDKSGDFQFSDRTNLEQEVLFSDIPDCAELKREVLKKYKGSSVYIDNIEEYVITETAYLKKHLRKNVLKPLEQSDTPKINVMERQRRLTYPSGCIIQFLT